MKTIDGLKQVRDLLEKGWTQEASARDADGEPLLSTDTRACSFCILGAVWRAVAGHDNPMESRLVYALRNAIGEDAKLVAYNDTPGRTQDEILALVDKAIENIKEE